MSEFPFLIKIDASALVASFNHLKQLVDQAIYRQAAADEAIIKEMLGEWVSELEPVVVRERASIYTDDFTVINPSIVRIVGLAAKGHTTIVVRRRM